MGEIVIGGEASEEPSRKALVRKPTKYDPALAERVLMQVADGRTLREIAAEPDMPSKSTIQRWIMKYPELTTAWKAAREMSASALEEEALDMARVLQGKGSAEFTGTRVRAFEVAMNQFRWSASHRDPATFGQTTQPNLVVPVQIITSLDIGQGGVTTAAQVNTYEVAAKINQEYDAKGETIEGTDYTLEQAEGSGPPAADTPFAPVAPEAGFRKMGRPRGPARKGHKSEAATKRTATRYAKKGLKNAG